MKTTIINDERILSQKRKIQSDSLQMVSFFLLISVIVQQFFLRAPLSQFAAELIALIGIGSYVLIKNLTLGLNAMSISTKSTKEIIFNGIFTGIISTLLFFTLTKEKNPISLAIFFFAFIAVYSLTNLIWQSLVRQKNKEIEKELDNDEGHNS